MTHTDLLMFGERLRSRRNSLSMTQEYVANQIDISLRFYQMIERGEKNVSVDTLMRLSKALRISADYLLFGAPPESFGNPITEIYEGLTSEQREDATNILPYPFCSTTLRNFITTRRRKGEKRPRNHFQKVPGPILFIVEIRQERPS